MDCGWDHGEFVFPTVAQPPARKTSPANHGPWWVSRVVRGPFWALKIPNRFCFRNLILEWMQRTKWIKLKA